MAAFIYYTLGLSILGYGTYLMLSGKRILSSVEWLNSYASVKALPPSSRVNFAHVSMWLTFNTALWVWLFFGSFLLGDLGILVVFVLNVCVNYLITKLSGGVRVKVTYYRTWMLISALAAICAVGVFGSLPSVLSLLHQ